MTGSSVPSTLSPALISQKDNIVNLLVHFDLVLMYTAKVIVPVPPLAESLSEGTVKQLSKRTTVHLFASYGQRLVNMLNGMRRLPRSKQTRYGHLFEC